MEKRPQTIENVITGLPERGPRLPARLASVARAAWSLLKACAELYGIACFIDWLLKLSDLV